MSPASRCPSPRRRLRASVRRPPASRTVSSSAWPTTGTRWSGRASTRWPASAWSNTWEARTSIPTRGRLAAALRPGGRLLNHGIARLRHGDPEAGAFSERFVFPDAAPLHLSRILAALERAGLETQHVEGFSADYAVTLRHWLDRLESRADEAMRLAGAERMRVWRVYLRASRRGFEQRFMSIYQVLAQLPG